LAISLLAQKAGDPGSKINKERDETRKGAGLHMGVFLKLRGTPDPRNLKDCTSERSEHRYKNFCNANRPMKFRSVNFLTAATRETISDGNARKKTHKKKKTTRRLISR